MARYVILRHICEVCGIEEHLTPEAAHEAGWDYPPKMGTFGVISPRTCPNCVVNQTLWWAVVVEKCTVDMLTTRQRETFVRITGEPGNITVP
ncbi:hypothetical protein MTY66_58160 [Mycolicibacterium sp. TY66]|nr:hypothetical protein MTY66_58160 [Mycolicibacterium sp. TY66]BCJ84188.1 hypothetical protein MTY81_55610 [Mycolicibacterium sp. TY81]